MRKIATTIAAAGLLACLASPAQAGGWGNVQPAYDANGQHATVRVEGEADLSGKMKAYGFADIDASREKPFEFSAIYGEGRIMRSLRDVSPRLKDVSATVEFNGGTGSAGTMRLGAVYKPDLGEDRTLVVKAFPVGTGGTGPQASVYAQAPFARGWKGDALVDYNLSPGTLYAELGLERKIRDGLGAFGQVRLSTGPGAGEPRVIVGLKYSR